MIERFGECSIGVDTSRTPVVDIDCDEPDLVEAFCDALREKFGPMAFRHGQGCRVAAMFRSESPYAKMSSSLVDPDGGEHKVEILGEGQQLVAYGYHPNTKLPYYWALSDGTPTGLTRLAREQLPQLNHGDASALLQLFNQIAAKRGWTAKSSAVTTTGSSPSENSRLPINISHEEFREAVMQVPDVDSYDRFIEVGMAISHQMEGSEEGLELWNEWASQSAKFDQSVSSKKWKSFGRERAGPRLTGRAIYRWSGLAVPNDLPLCLAQISEDAVSLAFADRHNNDLQYDHQARRWFCYQQGRWKPDQTEAAFDYARQICRDIGETISNPQEQRVLARASTVTAVERLTRTDRCFAMKSADWDNDPFLLGTPGGTVELVTGQMRAPERADHITMSTAVAPIEGDASEKVMPIFMRFLQDITCGDADLIRYLQTFFGYCLTGDTREQNLLFIHGPGGNGKSLLQNIIASILGDYAWQAPPEMFLSAKHDRHPTEVADLRGKRLVMASENENGRQWAEVRIKQLTGGDPITARKMRQDFFTFQPQAKFLFTGNNKPGLTNIDDAMRRRFHVLEFAFKPTVPDKTLSVRVTAEWPAILRWMIAGCLEWQKNGLALPSAVRDATSEYFSEQDIVQEWIDECCETGAEYVCTNNDLRESFQRFSAARGANRDRDPLPDLRRKSFPPIKNELGIRGRGYAGLRIRDDTST